MTKALALELAFKGVRVNAIAPGLFVTEINHEYLDSEQGAEMTRDIPVGRFGETATSTARCCCWSRMPAASWPARPSWSTAGRWWRLPGA